MKKHIFNKTLYNYLRELDSDQFRVFFAILVHCRAHGKTFISTSNLFKLWCELNALCYETASNFPCPYTDRKALKLYCQKHPYYFIDILSLDIVARLFTEYCDEHLDVLDEFAKILCQQGSRSAYRYIMTNFCLGHTLDELMSDLEEHLDTCS